MIKAVLSTANCATPSLNNNKIVAPSNITLKSNSLEGSDSKSFETHVTQSQPFFQNAFAQKISALEADLQNILQSKMSDEQKSILYKSTLNQLFLTDNMRKLPRNTKRPPIPLLPARAAAHRRIRSVSPPMPRLQRQTPLSSRRATPTGAVKKTPRSAPTLLPPAVYRNARGRKDKYDDMPKLEAAERTPRRRTLRQPIQVQVPPRVIGDYPGDDRAGPTTRATTQRLKYLEEEPI